jgi:tripartite-type tricarboxylate transporter receptor subunit TctC
MQCAWLDAVLGTSWRAWVCKSLLGSALVVAGAVQAQSLADRYPDKPIKIIVPFAPGGSVDVLARVVGQKLQESWGQPVVVESRPGASTLIGTTAAAKAPPDGYTLIISVSNHTTNPAMREKMPYDTLKDFRPVSLMARTPVVVYANPQFPANDLTALVALAKAKPGTVTFGSAGTGSMTHLTAELLKQSAGVDMTHVVYRGGTPALTDVISGHLNMTFATVGQALPQYRAKQVKALGISSEKRYASVPEIPTFKEQGIDLVTTEWYGLLAPAGTPPEIVNKLNAEVRKILSQPGLGERLTAIELVSSTPDELDKFIRSEMIRWTPLVHQLGIKAD